MRVPVEPRHVYRLLNHGPTTLISAAHGARRNVMSASWVMPIDFEPPRLALVVASDTYTRELIDASRTLVVSIPGLDQLDLCWTLGKVSGRAVDKFARYGLSSTPASQVAAPLIDGCLAWIECRLLDEPAVEGRYDLMLAESVAAWADDAAWTGSGWRFAPARRTIHHITRGQFFAIGEPVHARDLDAAIERTEVIAPHERAP